MANVKVLIEGYAKEIENGWLASSSVTLIKSDNKNIIVDPGCNRKLLLESLEKENLKISDIDFVINENDLDNLVGISQLYEDKYPNQECDQYESHHGIYNFGNETFIINLLVFDDDVTLETNTINYLDKTFKIQKIDTILKWKKKYNRSKDIKDLNKIADRYLEGILAQ